MPERAEGSFLGQSMQFRTKGNILALVAGARRVTVVLVGSRIEAGLARRCSCPSSSQCQTKRKVKAYPDDSRSSHDMPA